MLVSSGSHGRAFSLRDVDPETCMIVFKNHWTQVLRVLDKHDPGRGVAGGQRFGPIPGDEASAVQNYVEHMLFMLMEEEPGHGGAMGPILEFVVLEDVMEKLFLWSLRREFTDDMKLEQLRMYEMLLTRAKQPLLHHKPILRSLRMLLSSCGAPGRTGACAPVEAELVSLLHRLCCVLVTEASVLELFFHSSEDQGAANFLLFSLLIPFIHRDGTVGARARDALTLIMKLSSRNPLVAKHIAENTYFCPVLATGLSGLYSGLPAKLEVFRENWFCLERTDCLQVPELFQFLNSLNFCSTVCQEAHPSIRHQLLDYIYNGFLVPVMAPALHKLTLEEVMTTTAYLELFLRSIDEPALLQTFLIFILTHRHDNVNILDTLVSRINTPFQLGTVSLALFRTLIGLYCEDVMLQLVFRYLIPCSHLLCGERVRLRERDCNSISASALLSLTPSFFITKPRCSPSQPPKPDYILWSKVTEGLLGGNMDGVGCSRVSASGVLMEENYLEYLRDARRVVCASAHACRVWSAPYDGFNPAPDEKDKAQKADSERVELEWDDAYDATAHDPTISASSQHQDRSAPDEPPKHIQEMRRTAILLIKGSYVEESEFQDDVLVYNLIAQKDSRDDPRTSGGHVCSCDEEKRECDVSLDHNRNITVEQHRIKPSSHGADDFISQCLEIIRHHGGGDDEERIQKLHNRLRGEEDVHFTSCCDEEDVHFTSCCAEDGEEEEDVHFTSGCAEDGEGEGEEEEEEEEEEEDVHFTSCYDEDKEINTTGSKTQGSPFTGPFISVLLSRLESLLENSIEVNLLLTGILAQLASYPQALLRGFLLNTRPAFQPSVTSLYQVLVSVSSQIERYTTSRPDFTDLIHEAEQYLLLKDQILQARENDAGWVLNGRLCKALPRCPRIPENMQNKALAVVLFSEFLKELAAIAQEHSIRP